MDLFMFADELYMNGSMDSHHIHLAYLRSFFSVHVSHLISYLLRILVIIVDVKSQVNKIASGVRSAGISCRYFSSCFAINSILFNRGDDRELTYSP